LRYLRDGFQISTRHNQQYGGVYFSQLNQVDDQVQTNLLNYELAVDLLVNMPDPDVLDLFGRLNSHAVVLNTQERINADHFGPFKTLADELAHSYYAFWTSHEVLTAAQVMRMADVTLAADLLIARIEGIRSKKQIKGYYDLYEKSFEHDVDDLAARFRASMDDILRLFDNSLKASEFRRVPLFYSLFTALSHLRWGLPGLDRPSLDAGAWNYSRIRNSLDEVEEVLLTEDKRSLAPPQAKFLEDSRLATTDAAVRLRRTEFILDQILK
jgi:hypothetical protein